MNHDTQARKWQLTLNNPIEKGYDHERIKHELNQLKSLIYYCMSDEIGLEEKTAHTHVFFVCSSAVRFSTVKNRFPDAHIEQANGTSQQNLLFLTQYLIISFINNNYQTRYIITKINITD